MDNHCTYRCPVCSHSDDAAFEPDGVKAEIICRYCETPLLLIRKGASSLLAEASVRVTSTPC